jgi:hypothetical protein
MCWTIIGKCYNPGGLLLVDIGAAYTLCSGAHVNCLPWTLCCFTGVYCWVSSGVRISVAMLDACTCSNDHLRYAVAFPMRLCHLVQQGSVLVLDVVQNFWTKERDESRLHMYFML